MRDSVRHFSDGAMLSFDVVGHPEPAGSKKALQLPKQHRPYVVDANPKAKGWKQTVAGAAMVAMQRRAMFGGPVSLILVFRVHRPKNHYLASGELSAEGRRHRFPTRKPDLLKQARGVEDSLTGIVYRDDAQIVDELLRKEFTAGPEGVTVQVLAL
jgi:Holliday junction resolvase RusA-like endonuclease